MKSWKAPVVIGALMVIGGTTASRAQISSPIGFGVVGGTTSPSGPLSDVAKSGWHAGACLELKLPVIPIGFRLEGAYHQLGSKDLPGTDDSPRVLAGTIDATYTLLPLPIIKPYLIAGVGQYNVRSLRDPIPVDCATQSCEITRSAFGVNAGAGVRLELAGFAAFIEARWHDAYTSGKHAQMVPISVGLRF
jgi:hypothetical protein